MELMRAHHKEEMGPVAIYCVIADKIDEKGVTLELIRQFFTKCVEENYGMACRGKVLFSHAECEVRWTSLFLTYGLRDRCDSQQPSLKSSPSSPGAQALGTRAPGTLKAPVFHPQRDRGMQAL